METQSASDAVKDYVNSVLPGYTPPAMPSGTTAQQALAMHGLGIPEENVPATTNALPNGPSSLGDAQPGLGALPGGMTTIPPSPSPDAPASPSPTQPSLTGTPQSNPVPAGTPSLDGLVGALGGIRQTQQEQTKKAQPDTGGGFDWERLGAAMQDAGAHLGGNSGAAHHLANLRNHRAAQEEKQALLDEKKNAAQRAKDQHVVDTALKLMALPLPQRKQAMKVAVQSGVIPENAAKFIEIAETPAEAVALHDTAKRYLPQPIAEGVLRGTIDPSTEVGKAIYSFLTDKVKEEGNARAFADLDAQMQQMKSAGQPISPEFSLIHEQLRQGFDARKRKEQIDQLNLQDAERKNRIGTATEQADIAVGQEKEPQAKLDTSLKEAELYNKRNAQKLAEAASTKVVTNVNTAVPFNTELQKEEAKKLSDTRDKLQDAPSQIANLDKAKKLIGKASPFVGSFGDTKLELVKFFNNNLGTAIKPNEVANAGELQTRIFQNIMDNLKKMDAQPSQLQQLIMMEALGKLNADPKALGQMLTAYEDVLRSKVELHNNRARQAMKNGATFLYSPLIEMPDKTESSTAAKNPLEEAKRKMGFIK